MTSSTDPVAALVQGTPLQGRNVVISSDDGWQRALEGTTVPASSGVAPTRVEVTLCRTAGQLAQTLQRGASLGLGGGPLPLPFLRARQEFFASLHTTVFSVSLVVQARRVLRAVEVLNPRLRSGLNPPTDAAVLDAFVAQFGDSYVHAIQVGGLLQGVYTFYAQTRDEARRVEQAFGGAAAVAGLRLGPELSRRAGEVARTSEVNSSFKAEVWGICRSRPARASRASTRRPGCPTAGWTG